MSMLEQARLLLEQGRPKDAEVRIKQYLQEYPENDFAMYLLARCYYARKLFNEGITVILQAIRLAPEESFYYYLLGFGQYQINKFTEATGSLHTALQLNPYHAEYYGLYAHILISENHFALALEKANEGLAIEADNLGCLNARSMALTKMGKTAEARETMQDALAQDPDSEYTHNTIGWNLLERGKHKEAAMHFREALRINPSFANAQSGLKESLKSKVAPYRWLLQYSFWVNNRGKKLKAAMPFILYAGFRLLIALAGISRFTNGLAYALAGFYLVFVLASWTMNSIANFFLLFHPDGKYALTHTEKWSSVCVVFTVVTGFVILGIAVFDPAVAGSHVDYWLAMGMVLLSLSLPASELSFPLSIKNSNRRGQLAMGLCALGILAMVSAWLFPAQALFVLAGYGIGFVVFNWSGAFRGWK